MGTLAYSVDPDHMMQSASRKFYTKWAASWQNQQNDCASRKDSDQPDAQADLSLRWAQSHFVGFITRQLK